MASSSEVDAWIATLRKCEIIDENSVKKPVSYTHLTLPTILRV